MNRERLKSQMRDYAASLRNVDFDAQASVRASILFCDALKRHGLPNRTAETIAFRTELKISEAVMVEEEGAFVLDIVDGLAAGVAQCYRGIQRHFTALDADQEIVSAATRFTLELEM